MDLLDLKGEYGNAESLSVLGMQHLHGTNKIKRDFAKAKSFFKKSLELDENDVDSNYYIGLMYLLGLGVDVDIELALQHFLASDKDSRSQNALGYIYFKAPDYNERDPEKIH